MLISVLCFLLTLLGTTWYRQFALSQHILDIPNERSAHQLPIPRGGGIVFVTIFLGAMAVLHALSLSLLAVLFAIAVLGYWDDKYTLSAKTRLYYQMLLSCLAIYYMDGMPDIQIGNWTLHWQGLTVYLGVIYLVWILNLYNFMDGINGIAGFEALFVALGIGSIYLALGQADAIGSYGVLIAVMAGFLVWNFPKATVFMGDVGSGFLGFLFGVLSLYTAHDQPSLLWSWLILLGVFIVDATVTLIGRILQREPLHIAHAKHAYQYASRRFKSHTVVTLAILLINLVWLWPLAFAVGLGYLQGLLGLCIAYIPIIILVYYFKMPDFKHSKSVLS